MQELVTIGIAAAAVIAVSMAGRAIGKRAREASGPRAGSPDAGPAGDRAGIPAEGGELIAVIAAAISAASGMEAGSFRVVGLRPSMAHTGFNTPVWGHVDRFTRGE